MEINCRSDRQWGQDGFGIGIGVGHRRESRTLKAQIPVLRKHACQHRFATFAGILVLGAFCPCSKFAQLGRGKVRAKGVPARHGRLYKKRTFRAYRLPKRCIFATLLAAPANLLPKPGAQWNTWTQDTEVHGWSEVLRRLKSIHPEHGMPSKS